MTVSDLDIAKQKLEEGDLSFVAVRGGVVICSGSSSGIRELVVAIAGSAGLLSDASLADRIIGRAAALLAIHAGVRYVHAGILSEAGEHALKGQVELLSYGRLVPRILNRAGDDMCPMEKRSLAMTSPEEAFSSFSIFLGVNG
jgi:hypothetical protein